MASPRDQQAPVQPRLTTQGQTTGRGRGRGDRVPGGSAERELVNGGVESTGPRSSRRPPPSGMGVAETAAFVVGLIAIVVIVALL